MAAKWGHLLRKWWKMAVDAVSRSYQMYGRSRPIHAALHKAPVWLIAPRQVAGVLLAIGADDADFAKAGGQAMPR